MDLAARFVLNDKDEPVFNFGKYRDRPVKEIFRREPSFYHWMMQGDFPKNSKDVATRLFYEVQAERRTLGSDSGFKKTSILFKACAGNL